MHPITFQVTGQPKGQPRARAFAMRTGKGFTARMYDPGTAEAWKQAVVAAGEPHKPAQPLVGSLALIVTLLMPRPKRLCTRTHPPGVLPCIAKPDADNLAKAVMDALTVAGWWGDDAQVSSLTVAKRYHPIDGRAGAIVTIGRDEDGRGVDMALLVGRMDQQMSAELHKEGWRV